MAESIPFAAEVSQEVEKPGEGKGGFIPQASRLSEPEPELENPDITKELKPSVGASQEGNITIEKTETSEGSLESESEPQTTTEDPEISKEICHEDDTTKEEDKKQWASSDLELGTEAQTTTEDSEVPKEICHEDITTKEEDEKQQDLSEPEAEPQTTTDNPIPPETHPEEPTTNEDPKESESDDETPGENLIALLPTELCHGILSFLSNNEKQKFSRCSKHCYFLSFPLRFTGVVLSKYVDGVGINDLGEGKWLEPLKYHIRSAKIHFRQNELHRSLQSIAVFSRLINLTICLVMDKGFERNLSVAVISSLSKLPFYDTLENLTLEFNDQWIPGLPRRYIELTSDSEDEEFRTTYLRGPREMKLHKAYQQKFTQLGPEEKKFLGGFIKGGELSTVVKKLKFPKYLRSLDFNIRCEDSSYALPFFETLCSDGKKVDCGLLINGRSFPLLDLDRPRDGIPEFKHIKRVSLTFPPDRFDYDTIKVKYLSRQFPNLEVLKFVEYAPYDAQELWETLPDLQNLQRVEYPWPIRPGSYGTRRISEPTNTMEDAIEKRLKMGHFGRLRWVRFSEGWSGSGGKVMEFNISRMVDFWGQTVRGYSYNTLRKAVGEDSDE
ncbi:hypothetical protein TWF506_008750 [Arthrobotrys conoides]|uniref:F-box domain-containing protein n=1 Tax=Arthrobotrys conoides TaxID=74498 RepID=A0AAN8RSF6_9PEZI